MTIRLKRIRDFSIAMFLLVIVWYSYVHLFNVPNYILPSPIEVMNEFLKMFVSNDIIFHFSVTFLEVLIGFALGTLLGICMGLIVGHFKIIEEAIMPYILVAQTAPKIALAPLFVIWFGLGLLSKVVLIISMVFFPVMLGTLLGLRSISYNLKCLVKITGLNFWQSFIHVKLPHSLPHIFSGLRIGMIQAVIAAIVAEWISGQNGLGFLLVFNSTTYNSEGLFATIVYTIILGIIYYQIVNVFENKLLFWHDSKIVKTK